MERLFAENLLRLRKARGYRTQAAIAEAADVPFRTYQDIERGAHLPRKSTLKKLCAALGADEATLFASQPTVGPTDSDILELVADALSVSRSDVKRQLLKTLAGLDDAMAARYLAAIDAELAARMGEKPKKPR